jgi:hypothetical protein
VRYVLHRRPAPGSLSGFWAYRTGNFSHGSPRAWPIEVCAQPNGSYDFEFCLNGQWHRLPLSALDHAATEVSITAGADVAPLNYAEGVALLLAALDKHNWLVRPPHREPAAHSIPDKQFQDA